MEGQLHVKGTLWIASIVQCLVVIVTTLQMIKNGGLGMVRLNQDLPAMVWQK